jgi:hypothetical protein
LILSAVEIGFLCFKVVLRLEDTLLRVVHLLLLIATVVRGGPRRCAESDGYKNCDDVRDTYHGSLPKKDFGEKVSETDNK